MLKLYRFSDDRKSYWETWESEDGKNLLHWGELGTQGETKTVGSSFLKPAHKAIQSEVDELVANGFAPIDPEDQVILMIEYLIEGMGSTHDVDKRHRLEARMNESLGWTGLGMCDGGSIGSGTMEVCNFVVDFDVAKSMIEKDLKNTEFSNYSRIYREE